MMKYWKIIINGSVIKKKKLSVRQTRHFHILIQKKDLRLLSPHKNSHIFYVVNVVIIIVFSIAYSNALL